MGRQEQGRRPHRLHHVAGREGQAHRRRGGAGRHRSRHHVASRLEHSGAPPRARAARRRDEAADQAVRPGQPGQRISRHGEGHVARHAGDHRQPGQAMPVAPRSLPAALRRRPARHVPGRRGEIRQGQDRQVGLGLLPRLRREAAQGGQSGRAADGADERRGRLGRRAVQLVRRRHGRRQGQHQDRQPGDPPGARIPQEADGREPARGLRLGRRRQQPLAHLRQGLGHHEPAERLGGRQARQPEGRRAGLASCDAEGPEGPLRRPAEFLLRAVAVLQEQGGRQGPAAAHLAARVGRPAGRRVGRLRPARVQEHARLRHLEDGRAAGRHRLLVSAARRRADLDHRPAGARRRSARRSTTRRSTP